MLRWLSPVFFALSLTAFAQNDEAKWDVSEQHGPVKDVQFTTDEGTWMSVDISPDGGTLVFDLLGDLYTLPVSGGKATRISSGPAFDVQPRFSPDGSEIAFTSDRAGGDNIWIMEADGTNPSQVSKESFRLLNGPEWSPDGEYLFARKHFTGTRSLGAGEVWMYHRTGGAGFQVTKQKNNQQDQGNEISLSPDGRYVYFSEDMTRGPQFQYNKDPNPGIYAIRRIDRETGKIKNLVSGPGGAARPVPSPDGDQLAFVRRVRGKTVLYVYDLKAGTARPLFDGLDQDQQEAWAIFGVYPNFTWTPDNNSIIFWAQGKLWSINVESRDVTQIPFEVEVEAQVAEALRYPVQVHSDRFEARMITDAVTSPDGETLVFHAVGRLWSMRLPDGEPSRLTSDSRSEYDPSFSPDGSRVVYTTWDDDELSRIHTVSASGGDPETLEMEPGYYHEPRFSPDGSSLVYRSTSGNSLLGYRNGANSGVFWMPVAGGEPTKIMNGGRDVRFDETGERVYYMSGGGLNGSFKSVKLNGTDEQTHFTLKYPSSVIPSPDGKFVAFTELFNVYVAPFPKTGQPVSLSKETRSIPVTQVSRDAGIAVHWSGDGSSLHWTIGPSYFTRSVSSSFSHLPDSPDEVAKPDSIGTPINLSVPADVPEGVTAFVGGRIVTMEGDEVIENGTVVVQGNKIVSVGARDEVDLPDAANVIDISGKTVIPGLIDIHAHASHFSSGPSPDQNWAYYANLAFGITTMHDPSANTEFVFRQSELVKAGKTVGPRVFSTGTILYGADGGFKAVVNSLEDARMHLRRMKAVGAISVKSYNQPRRDQRQQILQAARELEMMVVPEGGSTFFHNVAQIIDGHTGIEHNLPVAPLYRDVMELWRHTEVGYTPTLVVSFGGVSGEYFFYANDNVWENQKLLSYFPRPRLDARSRRPVRIPDEEYHHIEVAAQAKKLVDQGNTVQMGAHGQMQGLAAHWEMWMFEQGGMSPHEALRSGTLHGAQYLGMDRELGSIKVGKLADLAVIDGNPLDDLRQSEKVAWVMANGRLYDTATMSEVGGAERKPFYWQRDDVSEDLLWMPGSMFSLEEGQTCTCGRQ